MATEQIGVKIDALRADAQKRLSEKYPSLYFDRLELVDNRSARIVVDDVSYRATGNIAETIEFLLVACKGNTLLFDTWRLTKELSGKLQRLLAITPAQRTAVLFPGEGARVVRELFPQSLLDNVAVISVPTRRNVDARTKMLSGVTVGNVTQTRKQLAEIRVNTIIVVDDVIASGATLMALREAFPGKNVDWYAGAQLARSPSQNNKGRVTSQSGIEGFRSVIAPVVYQGINGIPAVNSLSTLIGTSEKSEAIRERYMENYVTDPYIFLEMVQQLQQSVVSSR